MKLFKILVLLLSSLVFAPFTSADSAKNAPFSLYELKGSSDGATLLVIGGIHGDEPGGYFAPSILIDSYKILKGNVLVVPNLNPDSILAFKRGIYKDMNRKFARITEDDPDFDNVARIKEIITDSRVNFVINLHDGHGFYREKWENSIFNPKAWGQTYVIDQKTIDNIPFGNLDEIAKQIESKLNQELHYDFHTFGVRNTETRFKDEEQQNSLTYYAITHLKPALAIETSKNIKELPLKTFYQLNSIEALMGILGIEYTRDFTLDLKSVESKLRDYKTLSINGNITLDLSGIKSTLNFIPLLKSENEFTFTHPLGRVKKVKSGYEVYIGHQKVTLLKPDYFPMQCTLQDMEVEIDKAITKKVKFGKTLEFQEGFLVKQNHGARVNVIGYSKSGVVSEEEIFLTLKEMDKNFSLDKAGKIYRIEVYEGENFCGMINVKQK